MRHSGIDGEDATLKARQNQIVYPCAENCDLRGVFLAEESAVGLCGDEKFRDDGGDAAKVAGAGRAVEAVAQAFDFDEGGSTGGVKLFDCGSEDGVRSFGLGEGAVGVKGAWIAGVVFAGSELRGVDEDADGNSPA